MTDTFKIEGYAAVDGSVLSDDEAKVCGKRFEQIRKQHGTLSAELVLADAKDPTSPLHEIWQKHWGWDAKKAAEERWLDLARYLIRSVKITYLSDGVPIEVRAQIFLTNPATSEPEYVSAMKVLSQDEYRKQWMAEALKRLEGWLEKYQPLHELQPIFEAIEKAKKLVEKKAA